jgi:TonB family protein
MTRLGCAVVACAAVFQVLHAQGDRSRPTLIQQVNIDYGDTGNKPFVTDPVRVEMRIDGNGFPLSIEATSGLPDVVVSALSQYRFIPPVRNGVVVDSTITYIVPVRVPLDELSQPKFQRRWNSNERAAMQRGMKLDVRQVAQLEQTLIRNPEKKDERRTLLAYAATHPGDDARRIRSQSIAWLAEYLPNSDLPTSPLALINSAGGPLPDPAAYAAIRTIWLNQVRQASDKHDILEPASYYLRVADPEETEQVLLPEVGRDGRAAVWLGDLYALAALGVNGLDLVTGFPVSASEGLRDAAFAKKARSILAESGDARVIISALNTVGIAGRSLAGVGQLPAGFREFCESLQQRAQQFYAGASSGCDAPHQGSAGLQMDPPTLKKEVGPRYPEEAKAAKLEGTVRLQGVLDKEGKLKDLELIKGPLVFYSEARRAVSKWVFQPAKMNGEPVSFVFTVEVRFSLLP